MADFNLGAEVSMDVDPLKASKTTLERNLKAINKSLRDQRKEFKQNELSAEGLAKQENDLGRAIKLQEGLLKKRKDTLSDLDMQLRKSNKVTDEQKIKLQNASRAVQQAENQLNGFQNELKQTQTSQKLLGRSTDEVKNSLGQLKRQAQLTDLTFKQSSKSTSDYQDHLQNLNRTMEKQGAHLKLLKGNLKEVERSHGSNSRAADKLRNDILKESIAFQILQGRIHETRDELGKLQRQQALGTSLAKSWEGMREQMDRIATTLRSVGEIGQGVIQGVLITNLSTLVPILGSVVSLGSGLVGMLTAMAGGAIGMAGAFGIAGGAAITMGAMSKRALTLLEDGVIKNTVEVNNYKTALSGIKSEFDTLVQSNQSAIFTTMANGINAARFGLNQMSPAISKVTTLTSNASGQINDWVRNSQNAKNMFSLLNQTGPKVFNNILQAVMKFGDGTVAIFNKMNPLFTWASQGFENMAKSFQKWANSTQATNSIKGFIDYTKVNLPIVGRIFGNVFGGIVGLFKAFSGHSHTVLKGMEGVTQSFKDWANNLQGTEGFKKFLEYLNTNGPKVWEVVKNITQTIWGLLKGMAPVGAVMLSVTKNVTSFTASMTNAHPIIGKVVGVITAVGGAAFLLAKPILLAKGAFAGLSTAISVANLLFKVSRGQMALSAVMAGKYSTATKIAAVASRGLGLAIRFMTGPVGIVITAIGLFVAAIIHLWKTNATFRKNVIGAWNAIKKGAVAIFGAIKKAVISIWNGLVNGVMFIVKNWKKILIARFYLMKAVIISVFRVMKASVVKIWTTLKNGVIRLAKLLYTGVTNYFKLVKKVNTTIFNAIKNFALKVWTTIKNGVVSRAKALWSGVRKMFSSLSKSTHSIFNSIKNFALKLWSSLKNNVVSRAKALWSGVKNVWNTLKKGTSIIFGSVGKFMSNKWNSIKSGTVNKVKSLWSGMKNVWGSLSKGTRSIMNSIGGFFSKKWNGIKKSTIGIVTSLKSKVTGVMSKMGDGIKNVVGKIKGFFTDMIDKVKGGLNKLIKGVNWVGTKLGMDKIKPVNFHTGTTHTTTNLVKNGKIAKDTMATVGDKGKGNGPGGFRHETIIPPKGKPFITPARDTTMPISKGTAILNGAQTHAMLSSGNSEFSTGTIPRFSTGSMFDILGGGKKPKKKKHENHNDAVSEKLGQMWGGTKKATGAIVDGGKKAVSSTLSAAVKGKNWLKDKIGDVMDWIDKPGKLLKKVLEGFGVNMESFGIGKAASLPYDMMSGMFGKLKKAAVETFESWFSESGGDGDGGYIKYLDNITTPYSPNGPPPGYPFNWAHPGIDLPYKYEPVYSTISGKAYRKEMPGGFGHYMQVNGGGLEVIYGHLSKQIAKNGSKVNPGDKLGISGNSGASTGPHLHYEMHKNGKPIDPVKWLKSHQGGGKKSGKKWASTIKKALAMNGLPTSAAYVNAWARQIDSESGGNPKAVQGGYIDANTGGNEAKGLVQVAKGTFNQYKRKGHGNVFNPLDNLLAGIAYAKARYGKSGMLGVIGHGHGYAKGTNSATAGMAQVFEKGGEIMQMRGGETVIPNDVSIQAFKQIATSDIFSKTQSAVYDGISRYADQLREKQQQATKEQLELQRLSRENNDVQEQNNILKEILYNMQALVQSSRNNEQYNAQTANKNWNLDGKGITKAVNKQQGSDMISALYNNGGALT